MKTPISYYGGKQAIIHHILPLVPVHEVYTEVFFGGGTVFFAKHPVRNETINDRMDICINFYRVLKTKYRELKKLIDISLISRSMHLNALAVCQGKIPADDVQKAWAFWYASNFSFSNKIGGGIKYSNDQRTLVTLVLKNKKEAFTEELVSRLENVQIENNDGLTILKSRNVDKAFHYLDTPYHNADQGHYKGWNEAHLQEHLEWLAKDCKGKFMLSNYNSSILDRYVAKYGWQKYEITHRLHAPRKSGAKKTEVLVCNYKQEGNLFSGLSSL